MRTDAVRKAEELTDLLRSEAPRLDAEGLFPEKGLRALRDCGLMGLLVPHRYGGLDGDLGDLADVAQILAGGCLSTALIWAMHCQQVDVLVRHAEPALAGRLLPRVAAGELYLASITTEPGKGGHLLSAEAPLHEAGEQLRVSREAPVVTGGRYADGFLVTMRSGTGARPNDVRLVYLDRRQAVVEDGRSWNALGMRATQSGGLRLDGCVPAAQLVGEPGAFRAIAVESMIPAGHIGWAACWLGVARSALHDVIGLIRSPARPRGLDPRSDLVQERVAQVRIDLELVSAYLNRVVAEVSAARAEGCPVDAEGIQIHLNTLKVAAARLTFQAVDRLVQLAGLSVGYLKDSPIPLERHFRDLRSASLNNADDRLLTATGALTLLDRAAHLA
jgi:acyl-CoA dehydrogenase